MPKTSAVKATEIVWPTSTSPGGRPPENSGRLFNCYAEPMGDGNSVWKRSPGVTQYGAEVTTDWHFWGLGLFGFNVAEAITLPSGIFRGGIFVSGTLFVVLGESLYTIIEGGAFTKIGAVSGTDRVFLARNNKQPVPDIVLVCEAGAFIITTTSISSYPDADVGSPTCVVGHEGFFMFGYGTGDIIATAINDTTINVVTTSRSDTNPDGIVQLVSYGGYLYSMGSATIEQWGLPLNDSPEFPFNRIGYNNTPGLITHHAVAGYEPEFGQPPLYVGSDHTVRVMSGSEFPIVSPPQLNRLIKGVPSNDTLEAMAYVSDGVPFWQLSSPDWTWEINVSTGKWTERTSYLLERCRWTGSVFAFDRWMTGDISENGRMLEITSSALKEINDPLIPMLESLPVEDFPAFVAVPRADFEFSSGVGMAGGADPNETNPYAEVSWSDDGGQTFKDPQFRELGRQSKTMRRITVRRCGMSGPQGRRWRIAVPSAVHLGFIGANCTALFTEK